MLRYANNGNSKQAADEMKLHWKTTPKIGWRKVMNRTSNNKCRYPVTSPYKAWTVQSTCKTEDLSVQLFGFWKSQKIF